MHSGTAINILRGTKIVMDGTKIMLYQAYLIYQRNDKLINHALESPPLYLSRENSCIRTLKFYYRNNSLLSVFYKNRYADNLSTVIEFVKLKFTISWSNERYCLPLYTGMKEMRFKSLGCERVVERINMFKYIGFESTLIAKTPRANRHFTCSHW